MTQDLPQQDQVVAELDTAIFLFLLVKQRYPLLMATMKELECLRDLRPERPFANEAVLQVLRDSFDMLVIDLYSIRERLVKRRGLFELLKKDPSRLHARESSVADLEFRESVTGQVRDAVKRLTQLDGPATENTVTEIADRFIIETDPLDKDRNQVRAHRFEHDGRDTSKRFIELPDLQGQIDLLGRYLHDVYLVVTHKGHSMNLASGNPKQFAEDFTDLIVHGSINEAATYYGLAKETAENPTPWYWHARREVVRRHKDELRSPECDDRTEVT